MSVSSSGNQSKHPCQRIRLTGVVQGVGFRPLIWRLANELRLSGWVRTDARGLEIEARGPEQKISVLIECLQREAPPFSRIDSVHRRAAETEESAEDFVILGSLGGRVATMIGPDTAVCRNCLRDMFDPTDRRWRYAFVSCAHCGPRYTVCRGLPFDRARTSFASFPMCGKCQAESRRPHDRRLHTAGISCPKCSPRLSLTDPAGNVLPGDAIANALSMIRDGKILAVKGPGGFRLMCNARDVTAVAALRARKRQPAAPFPVMFANALSAAAFVRVSVGEPGLLNLPERPIILLRKRDGCDEALPGVAPDLLWLGVVLPFSPLYYLFFHEAAGRPAGMAWLEKSEALALVVTSGNPAGEPPAIDNGEALRRLVGVADAFLTYDLALVAGAEDSVACSGPGGLQLVRRSRGYAPRSVKLPFSTPPILAFGVRCKSAICVTRDNEAFLSPHLGELSNPLAAEALLETAEHLLAILDVSPALIAHDRDTRDAATRLAVEFAARRKLPLLGVQHHHAHVAAVLAEHHRDEPVYALSLDGCGLGDDGKPWGGELLRVDGAAYARLGHLKPLRLAFGDHESGQPWRFAAAILCALGRGDEIERRFAGQPDAGSLAERLIAGEDTEETSSMGRLFDAVAGLLGICSVTRFRGQAGLLLEGMAERQGKVRPLAGGWSIDGGRLDLDPLLAVLADERDPGAGAALFHATLSAALTDWLVAIAPPKATVAASGGCLQNQVLGRALRAGLAAAGLRLLEARRIPPNDGGIALGQAWIAQHYL
ncbi:MAG: carbamoyltransferase HypF [Candidatus Accumulibacter sp.]|jgi:hydrogenase maturation protein HypF|nr:carbamoyltransferase HypF [Accumulibacter sp.]